MLSCCVAVAECNGDLKSFLNSISSTFAPKLTAITWDSQRVLEEKVAFLNVSERVQCLSSQGQFALAC